MRVAKSALLLSTYLTSRRLVLKWNARGLAVRCREYWGQGFLAAGQRGALLRS